MSALSVSAATRSAGACDQANPPAAAEPAAVVRGSVVSPTTKATAGHDELMDYEQACAVAGRDVVDHLREVSLKIYTAGAKYALAHGTILADTKFEFSYATRALLRTVII